MTKHTGAGARTHDEALETTRESSAHLQPIKTTWSEGVGVFVAEARYMNIMKISNLNFFVSES